MPSDAKGITLWRLQVSADRWPGQPRPGGPLGRGGRYGWKPEGGMGRFGAGWEWCLGVEIGGSGRTAIINLLYGLVRVSFCSVCPACGRPLYSGQKRSGDGKTHAACVPSEVLK